MNLIPLHHLAQLVAGIKITEVLLEARKHMAQQGVEEVGADLRCGGTGEHGLEDRGGDKGLAGVWGSGLGYGCLVSGVKESR